MMGLGRVTSISSAGASGDDLFLVASSFEPRCVKASTLLANQAVKRAVVFNYRDTLDTVMGRYNSRRIRQALRDIGACSVNVVPCMFSDPYSVIRVLKTLGRQEKWISDVDTVTVDITCFTKLHLLLLLQFLHEEINPRTLRICYTEPLVYATDFGKELSYGIERSVYLPYRPAPHRSQSVGLVAFLGHERQRIERILQELEPDICLVVFGDPGFSENIENYSRRVNESLIHRAKYDRQYRLVSLPANDFESTYIGLRQEIADLQDQGCDSIYFAPLGTKLQALGIDLVRKYESSLRLLLAYTIPKRYERSLYSQGYGPTYVSVYDLNGMLPGSVVRDEK